MTATFPQVGPEPLLSARAPPLAASSPARTTTPTQPRGRPLLLAQLSAPAWHLAASLLPSRPCLAKAKPPPQARHPGRKAPSGSPRVRDKIPASRPSQCRHLPAAPSPPPSVLRKVSSLLAALLRQTPRARAQAFPGALPGLGPALSVRGVRYVGQSRPRKSIASASRTDTAAASLQGQHGGEKCARGGPSVGDCSLPRVAGKGPGSGSKRQACLL